MTLSSRAHAVNQVRFCAQLTNAFSDNLPGQDVLVASHLPANSHWAVVKRNGVTVGTPAYMNGNCTPFTTINPGSYTFWMTSAVQMASGQYLYAFANDDEDWQWNSLTVSVAANPTGDTTIPVIFSGRDWYAASLVASVMDLVNTAPVTFKVFAWQGCPGQPGSSCAVNATDLYLEPTHADFKSIVAHELGHVVSTQLGVEWAQNYGASVTQPLCRCDHVQFSNQLHCLQSRESDGAARNEGWAHFYAAGIFNTGSHSTAPFAYYKEVLEPPGSVPNDVVAPPYPVDSLSVYRWVETFCLAAERNAELDWMTFMYFLMYRTPQAYSFSDQSDLVQAAGPFNHSWTELRDAAETLYGVGSPKADHLIVTGEAYGVDH